MTANNTNNFLMNTKQIFYFFLFCILIGIIISCKKDFISFARHIVGSMYFKRESFNNYVE